MSMGAVSVGGDPRPRNWRTHREGALAATTEHDWFRLVGGGGFGIGSNL